MDITEIKEVEQLKDTYEVNKLLHSGKWVLLNVASGNYPEDGMAYTVFTLGRVADD